MSQNITQSPFSPEELAAMATNIPPDPVFKPEKFASQRVTDFTGHVALKGINTEHVPPEPTDDSGRAFKTFQS